MKTSGTKNLVVVAEFCPRGVALRRLFAVAFVLRLIVLFRVAIIFTYHRQKNFKQDEQDR